MSPQADDLEHITPIVPADPVEALPRSEHSVSPGRLLFHSIFHPTLLAVSVALLKCNGPWFADYLVAALFVIAAAAAWIGRRDLDAGMTADPNNRSIRRLLILFIVVDLCGAAASAWLASLPQPPYSDDESDSVAAVTWIAERSC